MSLILNLMLIIIGFMFQSVIFEKNIKSYKVQGVSID
jgi:hypothetical protein